MRSVYRFCRLFLVRGIVRHTYRNKNKARGSFLTHNIIFIITGLQGPLWCASLSGEAGNGWKLKPLSMQISSNLLMFSQNRVKDLSLSGSVHMTSSSSCVEFKGSEIITGCVAIRCLSEWQRGSGDTTTDVSHSPHLHYTHTHTHTQHNYCVILDYNSIYVKVKSHKFKILNIHAHNIQVDVQIIQAFPLRNCVLIRYETAFALLTWSGHELALAMFQ